jgi:UDP-N-acetylmuramate dehydrogenase
MEIKQNYNLSKLNTFGIDANAKFFAELEKEEELRELFSMPEFKQNKKMFMGGGSNVLFTKDFDGMVILNKLKGIEILEQNEETVTIRAMGGVVWHDLVEFATERGYWGIENLSLIPGTVGAAPMQNIGAYGAELKNTLLSVEAYEIETGDKRIFSEEECELGYRDSIFKNKVKDKYFISAVTLKLKKYGQAEIDYRVLKDHLEKNNIDPKTPKDVSEAVAEIRRSKLPDPKIVGNAGSFFKNVFVSPEQLEKLQEIYPDISFFEEDGVVKIPAGWLIEKCGFKGKREGNVGVHDRQALVLVNHGGASGAEIVELANKIITCVKDKFDLTLTPEVNIV